MNKAYAVAFTLLLLSSTAYSFNPDPLVEAWNMSIGGDLIDVRDINSDGEKEIVLGLLREEGSYAYLIDQDGGLLWRNKISVIWPQNQPITLQVDDLDQNDMTDLVITSVVEAKSCFGQLTPYSNPIFVLERDPKFENNVLKWVNRGYGYFITTHVTDFSGDAKREIIAGNREGMVYVLDDDGSIIFRYPTEGSVNAVRAVDLNRDEKKEVLAGSNEYIHLIDEHGSRIWKYKTRTEPVGVGMLDVSGDGNYEAVATDDNDTLYVLDRWGKLVYSVNVTALKPAVTGEDFDRDGKMEAIVSSGDILYAYGQAGELIWEYDVEYPIVNMFADDTKGDGTPYIYVVGSRILKAFKANDDFINLRKGVKTLELAQTSFVEKNYETARNQSLEAGRYFQKINYTIGLDKAWFLNHTSAAYVLAASEMESSQKAYDEGDFTKSKDHAVEAERLYTNVSDLNLSQKALKLATSAIDNIDAQNFYLKAVDYYRADKYFDAQLYAEKSLELFEKVNNTGQADKVKLLLENNSIYPKANERYNLALRQYDLKNYTDAKSQALEAEGLYKRVGDKGRQASSKTLAERAQAEIERLEKLQKAEDHYLTARSKYQKAIHQTCVSELELAIPIYKDIKDADGVEKSNLLKTQCERGVEGQKYYSKAQAELVSENPDAAVDYALKARQLFMGIDDADGVIRVRELINEAEAMIKEKDEPQSTQETTDYTLYYLAAFAAILAGGAVAAYAIYKKRKEKEEAEEDMPPEMDMIVTTEEDQTPTEEEGEKPAEETPQTQKQKPESEEPPQQEEEEDVPEDFKKLFEKQEPEKEEGITFGDKVIEETIDEPKKQSLDDILGVKPEPKDNTQIIVEDDEPIVIMEEPQPEEPEQEQKPEEEDDEKEKEPEKPKEEEQKQPEEPPAEKPKPKKKKVKKVRKDPRHEKAAKIKKDLKKLDKMLKK